LGFRHPKAHRALDPRHVGEQLGDRRLRVGRRREHEKDRRLGGGADDRLRLGHFAPTYAMSRGWGRAPYGGPHERANEPPTTEDAQLLVSLAQWATALGVPDVMPAILGDDFDPDTADAIDDASVRTVLLFGESIGTLTKHDLISTELIHDWLWIEGMWSR